ncbi:MAG: hypothetical protein GXY83_07660 [Rhodopirellula sp.]|nr:hypothetical protein [Rhodopirellula sp.]
MPDAGPKLNAAHHRWLYNQFAGELNRPKLDAATAPSSEPVLWMDPADEAAFQRDFLVPTAESRGGSKVANVDGRQVLRLRDHASVGVDIDENHRDRGDRVSLRFRFRVERGDGQTLCTVGDFNHPARLIARDGQVWLCAAGVEKSCGSLNSNGWTPVCIETYGGVTSASIGEGSPVEVHHQPEATWVYLGEAFPRYNVFPGTRFAIDVGAVQTRVETKTP